MRSSATATDPPPAASSLRRARATPVPGPEDLEHPSCPLCGAAPRGSALRWFPPFGVTRCTECALLYLAPRLREAVMGDGYRDGAYFEGSGIGYQSYAAQEPTLRRTFQELLSAMQRRGMAGGRLLEVGCAYGYFLDEARGLFDHRVGTDFSQLALERARERAEELYCGGLEEIPPGEGFDVAACIHVIEHVYRPVEFLAEIRRRLRPGGWLVVATPDAGSLWRHLMGSRWPFYKPPEHVTFFDRSTLPRLLREAGFAAVVPIPYPGIFPLHLVAEKLSLRLPPWLGALSIRLPGTTVAVCGRSPGDGSS